jgi:predicted ATPase
MNNWRLQWRDFRGFTRLTTIDLPKLTLLIGRNNVGKTSAYLPLLLLRQTLDARDPRTALLTRGDLVDVGSYRDLVSNHAIGRQLQFTIGLGGRVVQSSLDESGQAIQQYVQLGRLIVGFSYDSDQDRIFLQRSTVVDSASRFVVSRVRESDTTYTVSSRLLPSRQAVGRPLREVSELRKAMREEQPRGFLFTGADALRIPVSWRNDEDRWRKSRVWFNGAYNLQDLYAAVNAQVRRRLQGISYLGPLRSLPTRTYRYSAEPPRDVGREGQFAPEMLHRGATEEVRTTVNDWLMRLGYGSLLVEPAGDDFFQVFLRMLGPGNMTVNIAHCGVGLSQLLPILVQGASLGPEATFIAQQPEIHLNPAQQCVITDFLIETANRERRIVIETHSEHILLRLRRRIAEGVIAAKDVAIYFCDYRNGDSVLDRIPLGESAEITRDDWPGGFFEEQLEDSFSLARAQQAGSRT